MVAKEDSDEPKRGLSYARVSDTKQVKEGRSITDQKDLLRDRAEEKGITLVDEIDDKAETGTDLDRDGIKKIRELVAEKDISYLLVDEIDRIGRNAAETLYFIYNMREKHGIKLYTVENDMIDISNNPDLMYVIFRLISSQSTNDTKTRRSLSGTVQKFRNKNWSTIFQNVPFGYRKEGDWITKKPCEVGVVEELHEVFLRAEPHRAYAEAHEQTEDLPENITRSDVRSLIGRPVYMGEPTTNYVDKMRENGKSKTTVVDESLKILSEDMYDEVCEKITLVRNYCGSDIEGTVDAETLVDSVGPDPVVEASDIVQIRCPESNCNGRLVKNGTYDNGLFIVHNYMCASCQRQCKYPLRDDWNNIIKTHATLVNRHLWRNLVR